MNLRTAALILAMLFSAQILAKPNAIGDVPYDLVGRTVDGKEVKVSDYKGEVVVISFWATWCKYCMKELPVLSGIQKASVAGKLQVIAINFGEEKSLFKRIAKALSGTPMVMVSDSNERTGKQYGVGGIPHMVIIGPDGKVAAVHIGYSESELPALVREINRIGATQPSDN
jgi:thiol-disulfide isomerase/thioredoxin